MSIDHSRRPHERDTTKRKPSEDDEYLSANAAQARNSDDVVPVKWEYYRDGENAFRMRMLRSDGSIIETWTKVFDYWQATTLLPSDLKSSTRVRTEYEAIHGVPEESRVDAAIEDGQQAYKDQAVPVWPDKVELERRKHETFAEQSDRTVAEANTDAKAHAHRMFDRKQALIEVTQSRTYPSKSPDDEIQAEREDRLAQFTAAALTGLLTTGYPRATTQAAEDAVMYARATMVSFNHELVDTFNAELADA